MNEIEFERQLREDWAFILQNMPFSSSIPSTIRHLKYVLSSAVDRYQTNGYITTWTVADEEPNHYLDAINGYRLQGTFVVTARLYGHDPNSYTVTLGFDVLYPPPGESWERPPKTLNRWELIAMEIENEVLSDPEVDK